ncbi:MAG: Planktothrix phage PaV-LD [Cyanobacteriota bacterium]|jgi:hypothetical protein
MTELNDEIFDQGIENLKENFPDAIFTQLKYEIWFDKLSQELSAEEFEMAIWEAIFNLRQCPTGKELVNLVKESDRELVSNCWSRCLESLANRLPLNNLDDATQYAIFKLGGISHLGSIESTQLQYLSNDFKIHWQAYRKSPREFERPVQIIPPEQREFKPNGLKPELSEEQRVKNQEFLNNLIATKMSKNLNGAK